MLTFKINFKKVSSFRGAIRRYYKLKPFEKKVKKKVKKKNKIKKKK